MRAVKFWHHAGVLLLFLVLTAAFTYPLLFHFGNAVRDPWDTLHLSWLLAWDVHQLTSNPLHLFDANAFYPHNQTLAYSEHMILNGLLALPFIVVTGNPLWGYNAMLFLSFVMTGFAVYLLVQELTGSMWAGVIAGLLFAFCPYRVVQLAHLHLLTFQWAPLALLFLHRFFRDGRARNLSLFCLFFTGQTLSSYYTGFLLAVGTGMYVLYKIVTDAEKRTVRHIGGVGIALVASILINLPLALPYFRLASAGFTRSVEENIHFSVRLTDYLAAPSESILYGTRMAGFRAGRDSECYLFPGLMGPLLAVGGLSVWVLSWGKKRLPNERKGQEERGFYLLLLLVSLVLTFGPYYSLGGDRRIPLPYLVLYEYLPGFQALRVPARFGMLVMLALAVLAGYGVSAFILWMRKTGRRPFYQPLFCTLLAGLVACDVSIRPGTVTAFAFAGGQIPPVYRWLAEIPEPLTIVELPMRQDFPPYAIYEFEYLYYSTFHWKKMVNGWSSFLPPRYEELQLLMQSFPSQESVGLLQGLDVAYAIFHAEKASDRKRISVLRQATQNPALKLIQKFGGDYVFLIQKSPQEKKKVSERVPLQLTTPSQARYGGEVSLAMGLANQSEKPLVFYPNQSGHLQASWEGARGSVNQKLVLPLVILPAHTAPVCVTLPTPPREGKNTVRVDLHLPQPHIRWPSVREIEVSQNVLTSAAPGQLAAEYLEVRAPAEVYAGELFSVSAQVKNVGDTIWLAHNSPASPPDKGKVQLATHGWVDQAGNTKNDLGWRGHLPCDIAPGDQVEVVVQARAPLEVGLYQLQISMVDESTSWFSGENKEFFGVPIHVYPANPPPRATVFRNTLQLFTRGPDGRLYRNLKTAARWSGWQQIALETFSGEPDPVVFHNALYVFVRGDNGAAYYKTSADGTSWSPWRQVDAALFSFGPVPVVFQGRLWLFVRGNNGLPYYTSSSDGLSWEPWRNVSPIHFSSGPTPMVFQDKLWLAVVFQGRLWLVVRGNDGLAYYTFSSDGVSWEPWRKASPVRFSSGPTPVVFQGRLWLFVRGEDERAYSLTSADGTTWPPGAWSNVAPDSIGGPLETAPTVTVFEGQLVLVAAGDDGQVYYKTSADGVRWVPPAGQPWFAVGAGEVDGPG